MSPTPQTDGPLAAHALTQANAHAAEPWSDRTAASHLHGGREWAVIVDWAVTSDGTRVPASVTLSSLGATLTDPPADVGPAPVTRALVDSIPWASVIAASRADLLDMPGVSGDWAAFRNHEQTPAERARQQHRDGSDHHDQMLRLTAHLYLSLGGESTRGIARRVHSELVRLGAAPMRRGPNPDEAVLTEQTVRRWIAEARNPKRGYIPPSRRSAKHPKTS
jgi:hypothetical protein